MSASAMPPIGADESAGAGGATLAAAAGSGALAAASVRGESGVAAPDAAARAQTRQQQHATALALGFAQKFITFFVACNTENG